MTKESSVYRAGVRQVQDRGIALGACSIKMVLWIEFPLKFLPPGPHSVGNWVVSDAIS